MSGASGKGILMIRLDPPWLDIWPTPERVRIAKGIRAGMPVNAVWELDTYRWRNDNGDESSTGATFAANEVTNLSGIDIGGGDVDYRLRIGIEQTSAAAVNAANPTITPRLEFKIPAQTVGWTLVPNSGSGTYVEMDSGSGLTDGSATTDHGLANLEYTVVSGGTQEENSSDAANITYTTETQTAYIGEWALRFLNSGLVDGDVVYFRVTSAGTLFDNYNYGDAADTNPITIAFTSAALNPVWDQDSFRVYYPGTEAGAVVKRAVNTNWTQRTKTRFHIRFLVQETAGATESPTLTLRLEKNKEVGGWVAVTGASADVRMEADANLTEGGDTTQRIGAGTFVANNNWVDDNDGVTAASGVFAGSDEAEALFSCYIVDADVADADEIQLRVATSAGVALDTYTNTPTITVTKQTEILNDQLTLTDTLSREASSFTRDLSDSLTLSESLVRTGVWDRVLSDVLTLTENMVASRTKIQIAYIIRRAMHWR